MNNQPESRTILEECLRRCYQYIQKGIAKQCELESVFTAQDTGKKEYGIQSKHLPRGVYCPSPDLEYIITNMRRGKIAERTGKNFRPTNQYLFDASGHLRIAETYYPDGSTKKEFLFYEKDTVYGVVFDNNGGLSEVSIAEYEGKQIKSYLWASCLCQRSKNDHLILSVLYEVYDYSVDGILTTDFYNIPGTQIELAQHQQYLFHLDKSGKVTGVN